MNWKEFLKPYWRKIVIFLLVLLLANIPYIGTYKADRAPCACPLVVGVECVCPEEYEFKLNPIFWPPFLRIFTYLRSQSLLDMIPLWYIFAYPDLNLHFDIYQPFSPLKIIGVFLYWYLLSCLIIWIYDKRKKKNLTK